MLNPWKTVIDAIRTEVEIKSTLCNIVKELPITMNEIIDKASDDEFIKEVKDKLNSKDQNVSEVYSLCNDMYGDRVIIPSTLQKRTLKEFHVGHPGTSRMKSLMRSYVYWINMNKDIENTVRSCKECTLATKAPPRIFNPCPKADRQ